MTFWSNGSFDPNTKEFYVAICSGLFAATLSEFLMLKLFKKGLLAGSSYSNPCQSAPKGYSQSDPMPKGCLWHWIGIGLA